MRPFVFLFATLAFASIKAPVLLEHETQIVTQTIMGKQWTRIFSCNGPSVDVLPDIQELARTATQVLITENLSAGRYVYSQPDTYPIRRLRAGQTLSFQVVPPAASSFASQSVIAQTWVGPADLLARLWNSCGTASQLSSPNGMFYWACNNVNGLHLGPNGATCMWDWSKRGIPTSVEIYIDAGSRQDPGCETCRGYEGKRWNRIFSCSPTVSQFGFSASETMALAQQASQVLINNQYDYYATSNPGSYPIQRLRLGQTISFPLSPTDKYAEPQDISANWQGPSFLLNSLWNTCGTAGLMNNTLYWACNNQAGLHITTGHCEWDWQSPNGPIEVFVDAPCSCPNDPPPPPPPPSYNEGGVPPPPPSGGGGYGYGYTPSY